MFSITPFSPEPYTPLADELVIFYDWRGVINNWQSPSGRARQVYKGQNIEAMILPQIAGIHTLQRRIALNKATRANRQKVIDFIINYRGAIEDFYTSIIG